MRRILAAVVVGFICQAGVARAQPAPPPTSATAQGIIASISRRVSPTYTRDLRDFENAALTMRGRERLRRMFVVDMDLNWYAPGPAELWQARLETSQGRTMIADT